MTNCKACANINIIMNNEQAKNTNVEQSNPNAVDWEVTSDLDQSDLGWEMHDLIQQAVEEEANGETDSQEKREAVARELGKYAMLQQDTSASDKTEVGQFHIPDAPESDSGQNYA